MCIIRRGVCPSCAAGNIYRDPCHLASPTQECTQLRPGIQRGGARSCLDHMGNACAPSSPSPSSSLSSSSSSSPSSPSSPSSSPTSPSFEDQNREHALHFQQYHHQNNYTHSANTEGAYNYNGNMDALTWQMAACTTQEPRWPEAPRSYASVESIASSPVSWGTVSW